jgi:hypothetical protein
MCTNTPSFHQALLNSLGENSPHQRGSLPYRELLVGLSAAVQSDLTQIKTTFPEYTPHDWDDHIIPLFEIAKRLFGPDALLNLNSLNRFLFLVGVYAHDWGMGVGDAERKAIASGKINDTLLPDEMEQLRNFARDKGIRPDADGGFSILLDDSVSIWAEYVRRTHALRSADRLKRFLLQAVGDQALADAGGVVCAGHWMDFEQLRNPLTVRPIRMVGGLKAHVLVIALLVRLTDLFDIGSDRTPYALRRFIGPTDPVSVMEWNKHEALEPIDCVKRLPDRWQVVIRGTCKKPDLWPALSDLRRYLEDQLQGASGLLAEQYRSISDEEMTPDAAKALAGLFRLDSSLGWDVRAEGFKPLEVRFEFDREGVFRILANEIYGDDPHVFVRELLQNAIDASRQHIARHNQIETRYQLRPEDCPIRFAVNQDVRGHTIVTCRDSGIGMNEHIIGRFLSKVGSSYYNSDEFFREHIPMDAISRFGIGLLSCFMVAEKITIRTKRPSQFGGDGAFLIEIPGLHRHFRVFSLNDQDWEGTEVSVEIVPSKLASFATRQGSALDFNVSRYLQKIAGFVEMPIYVEESSQRVLILHPKGDPTHRPNGVPDNAQICQINGAYRWAEELQRIEMCPPVENLNDYRVDVARDLQLEGIEGFVTFPSPCTLNGDICFINNGMLTRDDMVVETEPGKELPNAFRPPVPETAVHWIPPVPGQQMKTPSNLAYQDGILVNGRDEIGHQVGESHFPAHAWLNYSIGARSDLTASRSAFRRDPKISPEWMVIRARTFVLHKEIKIARTLPPIKRLRKMFQIENFFGVGNGWITEALPWNEYPLIILNSAGKIRCVPALEAFRPGFFLLPRTLTRFVDTHRALDVLDGKEILAAEGYAGGGPWIIEFPTHYNGTSLLRQSVSLLQHIFIETFLYPMALIFLRFQAPAEGLTPERVLMPRPSPRPESIRPLLERMKSDPLSLNPDEWGRVRVAANVDGGHFMARKSFLFPAPFNGSFAFGLEYFNLQHPAAQWLVRVATIIFLQGGVHPPRRSNVADIHNFFSQLFQQHIRSYPFFAQWWQATHRLIEGASGGHIPPPPPCPSFEEFVPSSLPNA